jgi:hypothetical protein
LWQITAPVTSNSFGTAPDFQERLHHVALPGSVTNSPCIAPKAEPFDKTCDDMDRSHIRRVRQAPPLIVTIIILVVTTK